VSLAPRRVAMPPSEIVVPLWMAIAFSKIGVIEDQRPGASNPEIEAFHAATRGGRASDDVSSCSSFWCWVMEMAGIASPRSKLALSWVTWGVECGPVFGATGFFSKSDPDAGGSGHVGGVVGTIGELVLLLACNQTIRHGKHSYQGVNIVPKLKANGVYRWPAPAAGLPLVA
jgi:hypothetical protein